MPPRKLYRHEDTGGMKKQKFMGSPGQGSALFFINLADLSLCTCIAPHWYSGAGGPHVLASAPANLLSVL